MEFTREALEKAGFGGFIRLSDSNTADVPATTGVYVVYRLTTACPVFLPRSRAGRHKDPSQPPDVVARAWVEGAQVVYIGKATVLRKRIAQYRRFGAGTSDAHWGGRYIWQLDDHDALLVAWRMVAAGEIPRVVETALIKHFMARYNGRTAAPSVTASSRRPLTVSTSPSVITLLTDVVVPGASQAG